MLVKRDENHVLMMWRFKMEKFWHLFGQTNFAFREYDRLMYNLVYEKNRLKKRPS